MMNIYLKNEKRHFFFSQKPVFFTHMFSSLFYFWFLKALLIGARTLEATLSSTRCAGIDKFSSHCRALKARRRVISSPTRVVVIATREISKAKKKQKKYPPEEKNLKFTKKRWERGIRIHHLWERFIFVLNFRRNGGRKIISSA